MNGYIVTALALILSFTTTGCAALSQQAVGQTDRLRSAPFYKSYARDAADGAGKVVSTPVELDASMQDEFFYMGRESALRPLLDAMNGYLAGLDWIEHRGDAPLSAHRGPLLFIGSAEGEAAPAAASEQRTEYDKYPPMIVHIEKPSAEWRAELQGSAQTYEAERVLWIRVGLTEYPKADRGLFGKKVVLGTGYEESIKFLSAEDVPVEVLQVTGILLDSQGNILRAGAEGIISKDTPFWVQVFEARQGIDDEALRRLLQDERRTDLPGAPLKWQVALNNLVAQLLLRADKVVK